MATVLIVDDEPRIRRGLQTCIDWEALGASRVETAESGKLALEKLTRLHPDLVLTDIMMPDMSGLEMIELARDMQILCPFIIISGYADFDFAQKAIRFGVSDYILKPIDEEEVFRTAKLCLNRTTPAPDMPVFDNSLIASAVQYIRENYAKDLTLPIVARQVALNANYFSTLFSKTVGESFIKFLTRTRIEKARELLKCPSIRVYEVAHLVGYRDYRMFAKYFKSAVGQTPIEYRNQAASQ